MEAITEQKKNRVWSDMNPALDWLHADFNHTLVGACNEVYNLQPRNGDVARPLDMTISVADSAPRGDEAAWMVSPDWHLGTPRRPTFLSDTTSLKS